jgi:hypothetical protein
MKQYSLPLGHPFLSKGRCSSSLEWCWQKDLSKHLRSLLILTFTGPFSSYLRPSIGLSAFPQDMGCWHRTNLQSAFWIQILSSLMRVKKSVSYLPCQPLHWAYDRIHLRSTISFLGQSSYLTQLGVLKQAVHFDLFKSFDPQFYEQYRQWIAGKALALLCPTDYFMSSLKLKSTFNIADKIFDH